VSLNLYQPAYCDIPEGTVPPIFFIIIILIISLIWHVMDVM
jgi:hypothetical protein